VVRGSVDADMGIKAGELERLKIMVRASSQKIEPEEGFGGTAEKGKGAVPVGKQPTEVKKGLLSSKTVVKPRSADDFKAIFKALSARLLRVGDDSAEEAGGQAVFHARPKYILSEVRLVPVAPAI
jgi:hypothetical protein